MILSLLLPSALATEIPLRSIRYEVDVAGPLADVTVTHVFRNGAEAFAEATYTFPLPEDAAVDGMVMTVADREIVGVVKEREQARKDYEAAIDEGRSAALTEQERPNVFTQTVGNLPPGEDVTVTLHLVQPVEYVDGSWEIAIPLTVGPRFSPPSVADVERVTPPVARGDTGVRVDIDVAIETGMPLAGVASPTHAPAIQLDETGAAVVLEGATATRDFVLRWAVDTDEPQAAVLRQGEHLLLTMEPPVAPPREAVVPREIVWVVDTSCSMDGEPLDMAKRAMEEAFASMDARDSFLVMDFNDRVSTLAPTPLPATAANVERGRAYVQAFEGHGGTSMLDGIVASLELPRDPARERYVCFLTDGYIGNEQEILAAIEDRLGDGHLYAFGLGSGVNRYLLDEMARAGRGVVTYVTLDEDPADAVARFLDTIDQPVLSGVTVDWGDHAVAEAYPGRVRDLVAGQPLFVAAKAGASGRDAVTVRGRLGDGAFVREIPVVDAGEGRAIASTWARQRVAELERQQVWGEVEEVRAAILDTALSYRLLTRYTAFVAVDRKRVNRDGAMVRWDVPVELPDGVRYEAAVSREWTPPGDPLLTVNAPADARAVTAVFPWGETVAMRWDGLRKRWYHRFLVPRDVEDGPTDVVVFVIDADGRVQRRVQPMWVDGSAPELDVLVEVEDGYTRVTVYAEEPLRSIQVQPVGRPEHRVRLDVAPDGDDWAHVLELTGMWEKVEVVAKDRAMNTVRQVSR